MEDLKELFRHWWPIVLAIPVLVTIVVMAVSISEQAKKDVIFSNQVSKCRNAGGWPRIRDKSLYVSTYECVGVDDVRVDLPDWEYEG